MCLKRIAALTLLVGNHSHGTVLISDKLLTRTVGGDFKTYSLVLFFQSILHLFGTQTCQTLDILAQNGIENGLEDASVTSREMLLIAGGLQGLVIVGIVEESRTIVADGGFGVVVHI